MTPTSDATAMGILNVFIAREHTAPAAL